MDVTVTTPLARELPLEVKSLPNGEGDLVEFYPTLPGKYRFNVLYGGEEIPGSPFIFVVEEEGLAKAHGEGLLNGSEGVLSHFFIDARGLVGEPTVQVIILHKNDYQGRNETRHLIVLEQLDGKLSKWTELAELLIQLALISLKGY